ncbi:MAG: sodium:proton antiporter NhaD [Candidatus Taylorbacteria bacterium]|nr:sodium:proton antiporter NhaD [Candidatus Taylorbacteria bacterium]
MAQVAQAVASLVFVLGYAVIALETKLKVGKSAVALSMGGLLWILLGLFDPQGIEENILHTGSEIFSLVAFLLAAMSLVEIAGHYRLFDFIKSKLSSWNMSLTGQFCAVLTITFFLSAVLDNLTTTIVMIQIARKFFWDENLYLASAGVVIAANAGGAFSPIGDVTTIMLWLADKFSAIEIMLYGFLPSLAALLVSMALFVRKIKPEPSVRTDAVPAIAMLQSEKAVLGFVLISFLLPVLVKGVHLPPVLGILLGLGMTWMLVDIFKRTSGAETHLTASIEHLIQKSDLGSIKFFIGILLAVSALGSLGVLEAVSNGVYGADTETSRVIVGNIGLGAISSVLDNIPLTAIAIKILDVSDPQLWVLLALMVGIGGSLLSLGSAAGVVAMGLVKGLTFEKYFRVAFVPALLGFAACALVWIVQYSLIAK